MKNHVNVIKVGNVLNVSINGVLRKKVCNDAEEAKKLMKELTELRADLTDENYEKLLCLLNERLRIAFLAGLETDVNSGNAYLAGFNTPIPNSLLEIIKEYHENGYPLDSIINFWRLLMINPDKRIRESLFDFISKHDFVLTDKGYMIVYKAVYLKDDVSKEQADFEEFVSAKYLHVKNNWKTNPKRYVVYTNVDDEETFLITKQSTVDKWFEQDPNGINIIGNLGELFENLGQGSLFDDKSTLYTDMYSCKMSIKLGEVCKMDRTKCDSNPANECSYGLHVGATSYVESYANSTSKILVCMINPANVVAVPNYDKSKMRVTEYFPFALAERIDGKIQIIDQPYYEDDYSDIELAELEEMVEKVQSEELPITTAKGAEQESRTFEELKKMIESRILDLNS
jgi:hypothetical protein